MATFVAADAREERVQKEFAGQLAELRNEYDPEQRLEDIEEEEKVQKKRKKEDPLEKPEMTIRPTDHGYHITTHSDAVVINEESGKAGNK